MTIRLGGWQRLGIVLSLIWIVGAVVTVHISTALMIEQWVSSTTSQCFESSRSVEASKRRAETTACVNEERSEIPVMVKDAESYEWYQYLYFALIPVPFGWMFGFIAVSASKWVRAGFREA